MTNDEINARISYKADLVVSRGCAGLSILAALVVIRLLWLAHRIDEGHRPDVFALAGALVFLGVGGICALCAVVLHPKRREPAQLIGHASDLRMSLESLVAVLDESHAAARPEPSEPVWRKIGRGHSAAASDLLATVLRAFAAGPEPCFLSTDGTVEVDELGAGSWGEPVAPHTWAVPPDFDPDNLLKSPVHLYGNYAFYVRDCVLPDGLPPGLPWWGPKRWRGRALQLRAGLRAASVVAALAVHPDASDWILAIPAQPRSGSDSSV